MKRVAVTAKPALDAGFTLVELMIVVTIIGVLAAIAIPRYIGYVRASESSEVGQIAGQIVQSVNGYIDAQSLTAAAAVTAFNGAYLYAPGDTAPSSGTSLPAMLPTMNLPGNAKYDYTVGAIAATSGPMSGNTVFCVLATGRSSAGIPGGVVAYSSVPAGSSAGAGWKANMNNIPYSSGVVGATTITPGGYCGTGGAVSATYN